MSSEHTSNGEGAASSSEEKSAHEPENSSEKLLRVTFDLSDNVAELALASTEVLWAQKTAELWQVRVRNLPFFVYGIALDDIVRIRADNVRRQFVFEELVAESGHSNIRIFIKDRKVEGLLRSILLTSHCSWEIYSTETLWSIDIPEGVDYNSLRRELAALFDSGAIDFQEAALSMRHRDSLA